MLCSIKLSSNYSAVSVSFLSFFNSNWDKRNPKKVEREKKNCFKHYPIDSTYVFSGRDDSKLCRQETTSKKRKKSLERCRYKSG